MWDPRCLTTLWASTACYKGYKAEEKILLGVCEQERGLKTSDLWHSSSYIKNVIQNEKRLHLGCSVYGSHNKQRLLQFSIINQLVCVTEARCLLWGTKATFIYYFHEYTGMSANRLNSSGCRMSWQQSRVHFKTWLLDPAKAGDCRLDSTR
jgi:hypothetical protein